MTIPTEPIGRIPRPLGLVEAFATHDCDDPVLDALYEDEIRDTLQRFEETGSPVVTDGEQRKYHNFATYCVDGLPNMAPDGFRLPFITHTRRWPRLTSAPFRYKRYADAFLDYARQHTSLPVKQAVIAPSAISLMYPAEGMPGYSRDEFIADALVEHETEVRRCLEKGAYKVQEEIYASAVSDSLDLLEFQDGRVIERSSKIQRIEERPVGRVWSYRDITERRRAEETLRDEARMLELLNKTGVATVRSYLVMPVISSSGEVIGGRWPLGMPWCGPIVP